MFFWLRAARVVLPNVNRKVKQMVMNIPKTDKLELISLIPANDSPLTTIIGTKYLLMMTARKQLTAVKILILSS